MFTEEGRYKGYILSIIKNKLINLSNDELELVDEFVDGVVKTRI